MILVTGATGYVGGRLITRLLKQGLTVRAAGRSLEKLKSRPWATASQIMLAEMDVFDETTMVAALKDVEIAYYMIHSMNPENKGFAAQDKKAAENFISAAKKTGLKRIIYLGGLGDDNANLSSHLQSRREVENILRSSSIPVTIFRAAMIIGSGSASFEILRYLVDRLPVMLTPKWVHTPTQPIAIANVLTYLTECLDKPETIDQTFDIGGAERLDYEALMSIYAEEAGLQKRFIIPVPVFSPNISSYWIHFITPVHASIARPLAEGLKNPTVCTETRIRDIIPQELYTPREAIHRALDRIKNHQVETHWTDAGYLPPPAYVYPGDPDWSGGTVYKDIRSIELYCQPDDLWDPIIKIGGETGWYYGDWLWHLRGILDLFFGGIGLRGGRRDPNVVHSGDALDFWRVITAEPGKRLTLLAEMKVPGEAFLTFALKKRAGDRDGEDVTVLTQKAVFAPKGLTGILYWYAVTPLHHFIFNGMLNGIAKASQHKKKCGPYVNA
ncbi:MAG: SDR family oxidoreductase [Cyanobacteria bacterium P01_H01_bin.74]